MRSIGIDLHKRSLTVCVIDKTTGETFASRFLCQDRARLLAFFERQRPFEAVIEASATYEWLWLLLEPMAHRLVLAHPRKLRIIAESKKKTDRSDAETLAWLLAQDEIPEAHRPSPRQRQYQHLVRHRCALIRSRTRIKNLIRSLLAARNLDHPDLFGNVGEEWIAALDVPEAERFRVGELWEHLKEIQERIGNAEEELKKFREAAPPEERRKHEIARSVPGVGDVVADVVLSTLGNVERFPSIQKVTAYAGLVPGVRESDRKRKELGITKEGPKLLRWVLVEAAWRAVQYSAHWEEIFNRLARRRGRKKAIVALARRILGVVYSLLKNDRMYVRAAREERRRRRAAG